MIFIFNLKPFIKIFSISWEFKAYLWLKNWFYFQCCKEKKIVSFFDAVLSISEWFNFQQFHSNLQLKSESLYHFYYWVILIFCYLNLTQKVNLKVTNLKHFTFPNYTVTNIAKVLDCDWKYCLLFSALQSYCFYCLLLKMLPNYFKCPIFFIVLYFFLSIQISYLNHRFEFAF